MCLKQTVVSFVRDDSSSSSGTPSLKRGAWWLGLFRFLRSVSQTIQYDPTVKDSVVSVVIAKYAGEVKKIWSPDRRGILPNHATGSQDFSFIGILGPPLPSPGAWDEKIPGNQVAILRCSSNVFKWLHLVFFSDYRAELYTRLVIEESKKQARKKRAKGSRAALQGQQREVGSSWSFLSPRKYMESASTKGFLRFLARTSFLQQMFIYFSDTSRQTLITVSCYSYQIWRHN